jgi:hypothetical protein
VKIFLGKCGLLNIGLKLGKEPFSENTAYTFKKEEIQYV